MDGEVQSPFLGFQSPVPKRLTRLCDKAFFRSLIRYLDVLLQEDYDWDKYDTLTILRWLMTMPRSHKKRAPRTDFGPSGKRCVDCGTVVSQRADTKRCSKCEGKERSRLLAR